MSVSRQIINHGMVWLVLPVVVLLALYVSTGRYFFPLLENYREEVIAQLNEGLAIDLKVGQIRGQWNDFDPFIQLDQVAIHAPLSQDRPLHRPAIEVDHFSLELDSFRSFRYQFPVIRQASIEGVTLRVEQQADSNWLLSGWQAAGEDAASANGQRQSRLRQDVAPIARLLQFLLRQQHLKMEHVWLELKDRYGREYRAYSRQLEVYESDGRHRLQGDLQLNPDTPQKIAFIMEVSGDPFEQSSLAVDLYLQADAQPLDSWIEKIAHLLPVKLPRLAGGLELWSHWEKGQLQTLNGRLQAGEMALQIPEQPEIRLSSVDAGLFWQRQQKGWQLIVDQPRFSLQEQTFEMQQLMAQQRDQLLQLQVSDLELQTLTRTLQRWPALPARARDALKRLQPEGQLKNLKISRDSDSRFRVETELDRVSVAAYYGAPVLKNVSGYVASDAASGFIRFNTSDFFMEFPRLYRQGWSFDHAQGEVHWQLNETLRVYGLGLELRQGDTEIAGEFDLYQPPEDDDLFYLNVGLQNAGHELGLQLVPERLISDDLTLWLQDSVRQAQVRQGGFIYDGTLNLSAEAPERQVATLLMLDIEQGQLKFLPDWPAAEALMAQVRLDGAALDVDLHSGRYLDNESISGSLDLRDAGNGSVVGLNLNAGLIPEKSWQIFTKTPLRTLIPDSLQQWQLSGPPLELATDLSFPVNGQPGSGSVRVGARGSRLLIPELGTPVEQLNADVLYDLTSGLTVRDADAQFLSGPASFSVSTNAADKTVQVTGKGQAPLLALSRWQPMPFSSWLDGILDYRFQVDLDRVSRLQLDSELEQVAVHLPEPVGKAAGEKRPLSVAMQFSDQGHRFDIDYGQPTQPEYLVSQGRWGGDQEGYAASVWYGDATQEAAPPVAVTNRTDIYVRQPQLDIAPWIDFVQQQTTPTAEADIVPEPVDATLLTGHIPVEPPAAGRGEARLHLKTDQLRYRSMAVNDLTVDAVLTDQNLQARFASQQLDGVVNYDTSQGIHLDMGRVFIPEIETDDFSEIQSSTGAPVASPETWFSAEWPDLRINIDEFMIAGIRGQQLDARYQARDRSRQIRLNNLSQGGISFSGNLDWQPADKTEAGRTALVLALKGNDLTDVQKGFDIPVAVSSSAAESRLQLSWLGMPHEVDTKSLAGRVSVDLKNGHFEQMPSVPALKLLSLFNFESLVRRLQLDFSDLSGKGLSYDEVNGVLSIEQGIGRIIQPIRIKGTSTQFELTGQLDFNEEVFDQEMVVTLPVGETLPFAAALAGAPQIGGTIYIVQKVFGNLFDKFTRATYTIKGDWDQPSVKLKRVF